jgi:hypothetical protein
MPHRALLTAVFGTPLFLGGSGQGDQPQCASLSDDVTGNRAAITFGRLKDDSNRMENRLGLY